MINERLQLNLPFLNDVGCRSPAANAIVEVVFDQRRKRVRVRPIDYEGWVKFPMRLRELGARYRVELLQPRPGGAWIALGKIRKLPRRSKKSSL